jgi:hypothetical protein
VVQQAAEKIDDLGGMNNGGVEREVGVSRDDPGGAESTFQLK